MHDATTSTLDNTATMSCCQYDCNNMTTQQLCQHKHNLISVRPIRMKVIHNFSNFPERASLPELNYDNYFIKFTYNRS